MSYVTDRAYGSNSLWVWWQGLRDRLQGRHARANARRGFLRPPLGTGRLVWVEAGGDEDSIRLALGALRALRESRLDLRLVLTFEHEYRPLLERDLAGLANTGFGYGPCDTPRVVRRTLRALSPFGVIIAGRRPAANLCAALAETSTRCIALHTPAATTGHFEAAYPADNMQAQSWRQCARADYVAPAADLATLLVEAQVDPNFRGLLTGAASLSLWWLLGVRAHDTAALAAWWAASPLRRDSILIVSPADDARDMPRQWLRVSSWSRSALSAGSILLADDNRWLPAIAAASDAVHVMHARGSPFWQAMAGGCPMSVADLAAAVARFNSMPAAQAQALFAGVHAFDELERFWRTLQDDPIAARTRADQLRRAFWGERRRASDVNRELLQRVYDW